MKYPSMDSKCPARMMPLLILAALLLAAQAYPQESRDGDPVSIGAFRQLHSKSLDEERSLLVSLPHDYENSLKAYPVLFVLYGDQIRGYFAEAVHVVHRLADEGSIPPMIVVGIANVDRYRDLSPVGRRGEESGIEPFSLFVVGELIPFVESEYRTKGFRLLEGPQAGAAFGLYTLAERPGLFDAFIIENPFRSPPVHDELMPMIEEILDEGFSSFTFLQVTCSDREGFLVKTDEIEFMRRFEEKVIDRSPPNLTLVVRYIENNEDFIPPLRLKEGLRELFRDYRLPEEQEITGLSEITGHYSALSGRYGFDVDVPEMALYSRADQISKEREVDSARVILEYLVEEYPKSVNGYWGLANLHRELDNRETALSYYRKCLEIMPNMPPARYWIEKLESER